MRHVVKRKQPNSKMCLVCGLKNSFGLRTSFYELDNDELLAVFKPMEEHQGYPGRLHGGIATAILDETIGRTVMINLDEQIWGVTVELTTRFKRPIPLDREIRVVARITKDTKRFFEGSGEILLGDGRIAGEARGKYLKQSLAKIADFDVEEQEWKVVPSRHDPGTVQF